VGDTLSGSCGDGRPGRVGNGTVSGQAGGRTGGRTGGRAGKRATLVSGSAVDLP
jgi:hypothetical protein